MDGHKKAINIELDLGQPLPPGFDPDAVVREALMPNSAWSVQQVTCGRNGSIRIRVETDANQSVGGWGKDDKTTLLDEVEPALLGALRDAQSHAVNQHPDYASAYATRATIAELLSELKTGLISNATGGPDMGDERYATIRKTLLALPWLKDRLPPFIKTCRDLSQFWAYIKPKYGSYAERRAFLNRAFTLLIDVLEEVETTSQLQVEFDGAERVGRGGFGTVFKVVHKVLGIPFAVKLLQPAFDDGAQVHLDRFLREARILFQLQHPNIIRIFDVGLSNGQPWIRMEYFDGLDLNRFLQRHGPLPPRKARVLVTKVASALRHAHEDAHLIHRDLKPSNVMLAPGEQVKVVDFGLGVFIEEDLVSRLTRTGEAIAPGQYTAPELATNPKLVDKRCDIYSLGAIWYTALTNRSPGGVGFEKSLDALVSPTEAATIARCLAVYESRFSSMAEVLDSIQAFEA